VGSLLPQNFGRATVVLRMHHTLFYSIVTNGQVGIPLAIGNRQRLQ